MDDTPNSYITFYHPKPNTRWDVVLDQMTRARYRLLFDDSDLSYVFDPTNQGTLPAAVERHARNLVTQGKATCLGVEIQPITIERWVPEGSGGWQPLESWMQDLLQTTTGDTTELEAARIAANAVVGWHSARRASVIGQELRELFPSATAIVVHVSPWTNTRDQVALVQVHDTHGPLDTTAKPEWPAVRARVVEHLTAALETAGSPQRCGWREHDQSADLGAEDLNLKHAEVFVVSVSEQNSLTAEVPTRHGRSTLGVDGS